MMFNTNQLFGLSLNDTPTFMTDSLLDMDPIETGIDAKEDTILDLTEDIQAMPAPIPVPVVCNLETTLETVTPEQLAAIARESSPKDGSNRRRTSMTLTVILTKALGHGYDPSKSDIRNLNDAILSNIDTTLNMSDAALNGFLQVLNASGSNRVFASASRVSHVRCAIRKKCTTPEHKLKFERFTKIVKRTEQQRSHAAAVSLERTVARQDNMVRVNKEDLYKTLKSWFRSANTELAVMAVQLSIGLRFCEVTLPAVKLYAFADYDADPESKFEDNTPPSVLEAARADPERYIVNYGQVKKRGFNGVTCIRPIIGGAKAKDLIVFRNALIGRKVHNRSTNRRLRISGDSLLRDFQAHGRPLVTSALRGVYISACTTDYKSASCGVTRFHNSILGYRNDATSAPRYQVCECT